MGEKLTGKSGQADGLETGRKEGLNTDHPATGKNSNNQGTGETTGEPRTGEEDGGNNTRDKIEIVSAMVNGLKEEQQPQKRKRRTKAEMQGGTTPTKSTPKGDDNTQVAEMVSSFLVTVSGIGATKVGSHWLISKPEADAIAEPLTKILDRLNLINKLGAYADYVALGMALMIVVVPRVIMSLEISKREGRTNNVREFTKPTRNEQSKPTTTPTGGTAGTIPNERKVGTGSGGIQQESTRSNHVPTSIIESLSFFEQSQFG